MAHGIRLFYVGSALADHNGQFHLPVGLFAVFGDDDVIVGAADRSGGFEE